MTKFCMEIAGQVGQIQPLFESTRVYFLKYLTEKEPDFSVCVTREDLEFEQQELRREAEEEGMRVRVFTDPFLERAAIQRKFAEHLLQHNTVLLHGSTVAVDGRGYLFTASCGTGKSTHTRAWMHQFGSRAVMINDDKPFLHISDDRTVVCGSPWSGKHGLDTNLAVPLQGICILERGLENRIWRISSAEAREMILHQGQPPLDNGSYPVFLHLMEKLLETVPLWKMECTKSPEAALVSYQAMAGGSEM